MNYLAVRYTKNDNLNTCFYAIFRYPCNDSNLLHGRPYISINYSFFTFLFVNEPLFDIILIILIFGNVFVSCNCIRDNYDPPDRRPRKVKNAC